jgi:hypothetical protein
VILPFLVGAQTLVASVVVFRLWLGMLPRTVCPDCGQDTLAVGHPMARAVGRWVSRRWCAACQWAGWGRKGPVLWRRKGPVADGSGFRWGEDRLQPDFGFQWKGDERRSGQERRTPKSQHPSGFHFADEETATETDSESPSHPSGFRFRQTEAEQARPADHPSGFSWGDESSTSEPAPKSSFNWGANPPRKPRGGAGGGPGFRWKD